MSSILVGTTETFSKHHTAFLIAERLFCFTDPRERAKIIYVPGSMVGQHLLFFMPRLRSSTMNIHPMTTLYYLPVLAAFGVIGAVLVTPLPAIVKPLYMNI